MNVVFHLPHSVMRALDWDCPLFSLQMSARRLHPNPVLTGNLAPPPEAESRLHRRKGVPFGPKTLNTSIPHLIVVIFLQKPVLILTFQHTKIAQIATKCTFIFTKKYIIFTKVYNFYIFDVCDIYEV